MFAFALFDKREKELLQLLDKHRSKNEDYDCIVPGSGGKDSAFVAHQLKYKYNMNPLTVTWAPHVYTDIGWKNFQGLIHAGIDNVLGTPNGIVHRRLSKLCTIDMGDPMQPFIFGQVNFPPRMAIAYDIPLMFYGENPLYTMGEKEGGLGGDATNKDTIKKIIP